MMVQADLQGLEQTVAALPCNSINEGKYDGLVCAEGDYVSSTVDGCNIFYKISFSVYGAGQQMALGWRRD